MKNMNTDTGKYTHNREATNGSAEIKLPGRQKEDSDIDRENIFRSNICWTSQAKNMNANNSDNTKLGGFITDEQKDVWRNKLGEDWRDSSRTET